MNSTRIPSTIRFCRSKSSNSKENIFNFSLLLHIIKGKGVIIMAQTVNVNFKLDRDVKMDMEQVCSELGLSLSAAFTVFAKKVGRERRIPFELSLEPFYSESNMEHLRRGIAALNAGKGVEHEPFEVFDE